MASLRSRRSSPSPVLRMALCETSSLNLNSGRESLRPGETQLLLAAVNTRLQGAQRPGKCPTQPELRTRQRCRDAKSCCVGANLCARQVISSPPPSWVWGKKKNEVFVSLMKAVWIMWGVLKTASVELVLFVEVPRASQGSAALVPAARVRTCHGLGAAARVIRNCGERAVNICVFSSAIWGKVGNQFWCLIYVSSSTPVVALSWKTPSCWAAQQNLISSSA